MTQHPVDEEGRAIPDASWPPGREAPGRLERVRRFLNTTNRENGADHLGEPVRAVRWLNGEGWPVEPNEAQLAELRQFRDQLHAVIEGRSHRAATGWPAATAAAALAVELTPSGPQLVGAGSGTARVVNDVLAVVVEAHADGSLDRLGVCAHCSWSFYDRSRNSGGQWCSMTACGQRQKMRRYRARKRAGAGAGRAG